MVKVFTKNLANIVTLTRIALVPLIMYFFYSRHPWASWCAFFFFVLACLTDYFDGIIARKFKQQSRFGEFLDPIADKILVISCFIMLAGFGDFKTATLIPVTLITAREILISGLREFLSPLGVCIKVSLFAKWKTFSQMLAIGAFLLGDASHLIGILTLGEFLIWIAAILSLLTAADYLKKSKEHLF